MAEPTINIPEKEEELQTDSVEASPISDSGFEESDTELQTSLQKIDDDEFDSIINAIPDSNEFELNVQAEEVQKNPAATGKIAAKLAKGDLEVGVTEEDVKMFSDKDTVTQLGKMLKLELATTTINKIEEDLLAPLKQLNAEGFQELEESGKLFVLKEGLQVMAARAIDSGSEEDAAAVRKYLVQFYLGTDTPEYKVNELYKDLEEIIKKDIEEDPAFGEALEEVDLEDGVSLKEYNRFVDFATEKLTAQMVKGSGKAKKIAWEEVKRVMTGFNPLPVDKAAFETTEQGYAVLTQSPEQDAFKYTQFGYWKNLIAGTILSNGSIADTVSLINNPELILLGVTPQILSFFFSKSKEQKQLEKEFDRVFGKDKWKTMTMARVLRESVIAYATGGLSSGAMSTLSRVFTSGGKIATKAATATNVTRIAKLGNVGSRALQTSTSFATSGAIFGILDYGADAAALKVQGKEITAKIEAELEEKLVNMYLLSGGFGAFGGIFSLGKAAVGAGSKTTQRLTEKLRTDINAWAKTKSVEWMEMMKDKIGPAVAFTKRQKLGTLFPKGTQRRQQEHIKSLEPSVSADPTETLRQLEQVAKATGANGGLAGEAGTHPEHLLFKQSNEPTLLIATQKLQSQRRVGTNDVLPGDVSHRLQELAKSETTAFPRQEEADTLFNIAKNKTNSLLEKFKIKSMSNLSPFADKELGKFTFMETSTRDAARSFHKQMLPLIQKAKNRASLETALRASSNLEIKLTPRQFVGDLGGHPKDYIKYEQIRNLYDEAHALYTDALSRGFNQKGFKTVRGTLSPDGGQILAKPYSAKEIFGESETATYTIDGVLKIKAGLEFQTYLKSLNTKQATAEISRVVKGETFVIETNFGTGITVLNKGARGRVVPTADLEPVTSPMANLQGYFPGYREERHLIIQLDKAKIAQKAQRGGTEGGLRDSSVTVTHAAPRYSIAKRQFDELVVNNKDTNIEHMLIDNSSSKSIQLTSNVEFMQSLGEVHEEIPLAMLTDITKRLKLDGDARQQLATAIHRATAHPTLTDRVKGSAARGLGKTKGAPIFNMTKEGKVQVEWDPDAIPYTSGLEASSEYLNTLAKKLGEEDIIQGTRRYFLDNYGDLLTIPGDIFSSINKSKLVGTAIDKATRENRLLSFQRVIALQQLRGDSVLLRNIGHSMVEGAKVANDRLKGTNPLSHVTKSILDSFINNPDLPKQGVALARKFTSIRLFAGNLRVAAFQVLPALENITYSMVGPKHILEPIGVAKDASTYLLYALGKYTTRGLITPAMKKLPSTRRALDIEKAIDQTGIIRELKMATPGGVDSFSEMFLGKSFNSVYKVGTEAADWLLYFEFRAGEGFNKLIASTATYRRMEIFRDAALKAKRLGLPPKKRGKIATFLLKPEERQILRFWEKAEQGDFILSNEGITAFGNEARLIAGDMARKANFPITNKNFLGVQFQYSGILLPRLTERYLPTYGRTFSPGRQAWNMAQIATYLGIFGVAGLLDVVTLYQDTMNKIFSRPDATGDVMVQRHIEEFAQVLGDMSNSLDGDTTKEQWNKLLRSGVLGQHLSAHPGDIQKFLPAKMFSDMVSNYMKEGFLPVVILRASPVMSQIEATVEGAQRGYQILEAFVKELPEEGLTKVLLDPNARPDQLVYMGDTFKRMMKAISYKSGISSFMTSLEVFTDDFNGRELVDNQGRAITVPFPSGDPEDKKFRNFISLWMGIFPDAREEIRQFGLESSINRKRWARDVGRTFQKIMGDRGVEAADAYLATAEEQAVGQPDEAILLQNIQFAILRAQLELVVPSTERNLMDMSRMLLKQQLAGEDISIIEGLVTPVQEEE